VRMKNFFDLTLPHSQIIVNEEENYYADEFQNKL